MTPRVSVVMGVYNGERFVREAVDSILQQTLDDLELIVVDDGSSDATPQILATIDDPRLRVLRRDENRGHPASLNEGIAAARAPLIARLDADDVAEPERLERQVAAMAAQHGLDVLGTWTTEIDADGQVIGGFSFPPSEPLIRWVLSFTNVVFHPTVIMRRDMLRRIGGYDASVQCADDHDLFTRVLMHGGRISLLPERLLRYRRSAAQISSARLLEQERESVAVRQRYIGWLTGSAPSAEMVTAVARLQVPFGPSPASGDITGALRVVRRVRRRSADAGAVTGTKDIDQRLLDALIHHVERLREGGRQGDAAKVWWAAVRCGMSAWRRRSLWGEAARLARAGLRQIAGRNAARGERRARGAGTEVS
jgi:GT2 family glycosyltransferase